MVTWNSERAEQVLREPCDHPCADKEIFKRNMFFQHAPTHYCIPSGTGRYMGDKCFVTSLNASQQRISLISSGTSAGSTSATGQRAPMGRKEREGKVIHSHTFKETLERLKNQGQEWLKLFWESRSAFSTMCMALLYAWPYDIRRKRVQVDNLAWSLRVSSSSLDSVIGLSSNRWSHPSFPMMSTLASSLSGLRWAGQSCERRNGAPGRASDPSTIRVRTRWWRKQCSIRLDTWGHSEPGGLQHWLEGTQWRESPTLWICIFVSLPCQNSSGDFAVLNTCLPSTSLDLS